MTRIAPLTPHMVRVTLRAPGFNPSPHLDAWFGFFLGEPEDHRHRRTYTVRAHRPAEDEVDVDVALHDQGLAMDWLQAARPGDHVCLWEQSDGRYDPPEDTAWQVLAGDLAALPALARIVEGLPAGMPATVLAAVDDPADRQEWETAGDVTVRWLSNGLRLGEALLAEPLPPGPGYVWMAGETRVVRAVRRELRHERGVPSERYGLTGYWLTNAEDWNARYERHATELEALWAEGEAEGRDPEAIEDAYEAALERAGL